MFHNESGQKLPEHSTNAMRQDGPIQRLKQTYLRDHPVDYLLIGKHGPSEEQDHVFNMIEHCPIEKRPRLIVEFWAPSAILYENGPMSKGCRTKWEQTGQYVSRCQRVRASEAGGTVDQDKLVVIRVQQDLEEGWTWPELFANVVRPMSNCLRPMGIPAKAFVKGHPTKWEPVSHLHPMPSYPGAVIVAHNGRRRLLNDELARGMGAPKEWVKEWYPTSATLKNTISLHLLEYLTPILLQPQVSADISTPSSPKDEFASEIRVSTDDDSFPKEIFSWCPPDLKCDSPWFNARVRSLRYASQSFANPKEVFKQGLEILKIHRGNYTPTHPDPKQLQVVWWEFPPGHWIDLKEGSSMNFLKELIHHILPNSDMTPEQQIIAGDFVDELILLGVLLPETETDKVVTNAPLFCLPKAGQPGQWRILADMKSGRQNEAIGSDPTVFPRSDVILSQMYSGGYSTVVDASKFFYQFETHPAERKYLGVIHPITSKRYFYRGLPMGSGNSPSLAGKYGNSFLRKVRERCPAFQGEPTTNTWWDEFSQRRKMNGRQCQGRFLIGKDGLPAAQVWAHCDDFLIHASTYEKTIEALKQFLDASVEVGILCHPGKLIPPAHVVKYTGFLFDTSNEPTLRIPAGKRERSLAMIDYFLDRNKPFSRRALAVLIGVLESVTDATPARQGHTHLRNLYSNLHPPGWEGLPYNSVTTLTENNRAELLWWRTALINDPKRRCRASNSGTLIPSFGDGSGTGTGGTIQYPDETQLKLWMGAWEPRVWHFSSNWKELRTLLATLQQTKRDGNKTVSGSTFFYFTDNTTVYFVVGSGSSTSLELHKLVVEIKLLEQELGCVLEVVHVPGTLMITQGTDGLSRGVWCSALHERMDQNLILASIFSPVPHSPPLTAWACRESNVCFPSPCTYRDWKGQWSAHDVMDQLTLWTPPPEIASQLIYFLLTCYVERPLTTAILIVVPRVLQKRWSRSSRHVVEVGAYKHEDVPLMHHTEIPIPIVLLCIYPHTRLLPELTRMDSTTKAPDERWHRQQAAFVRGLQGPSLEEYA